MNKSRTIFLFLALLLPLLSFAQGWEQTYNPGFSETRGSAATRTLDGGLLLYVNEDNNLTFQHQPAIYKINSEGVLQSVFRDSQYIDKHINPLMIFATSDGNMLTSLLYNDELPMDNFIFQKLSPAGNVFWSFDKTFSPYLRYVRGAIETPDGDYILRGTYDNSDQNSSIGLVKIDSNGNTIWEKGFSYNDLPSSVSDITFDSNGNILMFGQYGYANQDHKRFLKKLDPTGTEIWTKEYDKPNIYVGAQMAILDNGDIMIAGQTTDDPLTTGSIATLQKVDADGNEIWYQTYDTLGFQSIRGIEKTDDGGFVIAGTTEHFPQSDLNQIYLMKVDENGLVTWINTFGRSKEDYCSQLIPADDQGFYLFGSTQKTNTYYDAYLIKTDSLGISLSNTLAGTVFNDENFDCLEDSGEDGLQQWLIEVEKEEAHYFQITDAQGKFSFTVDTGSYEVKTYPISSYWHLCDSIFTVDFTNVNQNRFQDIPAQVITYCPLLDISIGTPFLRRCFENTYSVNYCNYGTEVAEDAYAEISLDPDMIYLGSSIPPSAQNGNLLTFDFGDVAIGECGSFTIDVLLGDSTTCDSIPLGMTHCVTAHIFPDLICAPTNNWSGASVEVDAFCSGDSISFLIENIGTGSTQSNLRYIIVEDDVILFNGTFDLDPGQSETMTVPTNGSTFRLEAEQEPNHPGDSHPSVSVEGCGDPNTVFNFGFVNIFSQNDSDPFIDIDCRLNIGAYDPNDKQGFPLGFGDENYIAPGQPLEYLIRFQNTGTDTAFTVRIEDQLTEELDLSSVRPGAASHDYDFEISREGALVFTFDNIMLPDSNVNEVKSHGFVKFKVAQKPGLPLETKIHNAAEIYFDFNAPIITNRTLHTLGEPMINITVSIDEVEDRNTSLEVYPNPFSHSTNFKITGIEIDRAELKVYDARGALLRRQLVNQNNFIFEQGDLSTGMYFFTVEDQKGLLTSGKIMIH